MTPTPAPLDRLFKAARLVRRPAPDAPSLAAETRALAAWKSARMESDYPLLLPVLRLGFACACIIMVCTAGFSLWEWNKMSYNEVTSSAVVVNGAWMR